MSRLEDLREQVRLDLARGEEIPAEHRDDELDRQLAVLASEVAPHPLTVELLLEGASGSDLPAGWSDRERARRARLFESLREEATPLGVLLRSARTDAAMTAAAAAEMLGWDSDVYERVEAGRGGAALLNASPSRVRRLAKRWGLSLERLALSLSAAQAPSMGLGYGHRPRQDAAEVGAARAEPGDARARLTAWLAELFDQNG